MTWNAAQSPVAKPVKVTIVYCSACGYQQQTLDLAAALLHEFTYGLSSVELIPWHDGTFEVTVAGKLVHSMEREGGFPAHETVIQAVREALSQG
jgi:selenoprotein W-related protein